MNIEQLRNALEVAKAKSINKAADNLFISQPNLSRSLRTLEEELGYKIFSRNQSGVEITIAGYDFLSHAQIVVDELDKIQGIARPERIDQRFSVSVPKANYISKAFTSLLTKLDMNQELSIDYKESSAIGAVENILIHNFNLGIVRYNEEFEPFFNVFFKESGLESREICKFQYEVAFSKESGLAKKDKLYKEDFKDYIEISHGDSYLPKVQTQSASDEFKLSDKSIRVYDSMGQLALLRDIPNTFMLVFPLDDISLEKYDLCQKKIEDVSWKAKDVLIFRKNYHSSKLDSMFILEIEKQLRG